MFFQPPSQSSFWEGPNADLSSNVRFSQYFGSKVGPEMAPWSVIFVQKTDSGVELLSGRSTLQPTWVRNGAENVPKRPKHRHLYILEQFWTNLGQKLHDFDILLKQLRTIFR